jgi:lipopolysaccharide export system protein LptA
MILLLLAVLLPAPAARAQSAQPVAGSVVRSKEWIVRRGKTREEEFIGDVRYDSSGVRLSSDWALFQQASRDWKARGNVVLRKDLANGDVIVARGRTARYSEADKAGALEPAPGERIPFTRTPADGSEPDHGEGERLTWRGEEWAALSGRARVWGPRLQAWADTARYEPPAKTLSLRGGRPVARKVDEEGGWTTALKADEIDAVDSPRRLRARGKVRGWLIFKDEAKFTEKPR